VWDGSADAETGSFSVRPDDIVINPPEIVGMPKSEVSESSVVITWETDVPTDDRIDFGTDRDLNGSITIQGEFRTKHIVAINNLIPRTQYYYRVKGTGTNGDTGRSDIFTFETKERNGT
jgi:acid phosphatase type 7